VRVIKRGQLPKEPVLVGTCAACNSVTEAKWSEVRVPPNYDGEPFGIAECPVCGRYMRFRPVGDQE
jgi:uncharacterized protein with PIN domain